VPSVITDDMSAVRLTLQSPQRRSHADGLAHPCPATRVGRLPFGICRTERHA
jgi:hypothetical protein